MLNAKALSELLTKNSDERLCIRWFLITMNGTLLAYTQPANIIELRRQASLATMAWQENRHPSQPAASDENGAPTKPGANVESLHTLTVESGHSNFLLRKLGPQLLLVLEGGVSSRHTVTETKITPEYREDTTHLTEEGMAEPAHTESASSKAGSQSGKAPGSMLELQRKKLDALASTITQDLDEGGFRPPEGASMRMF